MATKPPTRVVSCLVLVAHLPVLVRSNLGSNLRLRLAPINVAHLAWLPIGMAPQNEMLDIRKKPSKPDSRMGCSEQKCSIDMYRSVLVHRNCLMLASICYSCNKSTNLNRIKKHPELSLNHPSQIFFGNPWCPKGHLLTARPGRCIAHLPPLALVAAVQGGGAAVGHGQVIAGAQRLSWPNLFEEVGGTNGGYFGL